MILVVATWAAVVAELVSYGVMARYERLRQYYVVSFLASFPIAASAAVAGLWANVALSLAFVVISFMGIRKTRIER